MRHWGGAALLPLLQKQARALLRRNATSPVVTAFFAAAVAAVYETVLDLIKIDIDVGPQRTELRGNDDRSGPTALGQRPTALLPPR